MCNFRSFSSAVLLSCLIASLCSSQTTSGRMAGRNDGINGQQGYLSGQTYNLAPSSRVFGPIVIYGPGGTLLPIALLHEGGLHLVHGSYWTFDFGKEVGGIVRLRFAAASDRNQSVGLAFTESSLFIGENSDASNPNGPDGALYAAVSGPGSYIMPMEKLRGGFRYLTLFVPTDGWVDLGDVVLQFTASPAMQNLRDYPNYFFSNDDLLNRIWYAGAYTVQMDTIDPTQGRVWPTPPSGWENNGLVGTGTSVLTDGAKRDRTVWPGDMGISAATAFVTTGDTISTRNSLTTLYQHQGSDGGLPYVGPEVNEGTISDTYHLWTLVATAQYYNSSGDDEWLSEHWGQFKAAVNYSTSKIDRNGVLEVTKGADWGRDGDLGATLGEEIEANALLYRVLTTGHDLAIAENDQQIASSYESTAASLKQAINLLLWDPGAGEYRDTPGSSLHPQDGNSLAVWFGLVDSSAKATAISQSLHQNWNRFGAQTPEKTNAIATFPGSMEVNAHFAAADDQTGLDLIRLEWGYMLNSPLSTHSTFWEGYMTNGAFQTFDSPYSHHGELMSHAHGWATGPTSALTNYVLGIAQGGFEGAAYQIIPHPGDLTHAEGALVLVMGPISASWTRDLSGGTFTEVWQAPAAVLGTIGVPTFGADIIIDLDGQEIWNSCTPNHLRTDGTYVYLDGMMGNHTVNSVTTSCSRNNTPRDDTRPRRQVRAGKFINPQP